MALSSTFMFLVLDYCCLRSVAATNSTSTRTPFTTIMSTSSTSTETTTSHAPSQATQSPLVGQCLTTESVEGVLEAHLQGFILVLAILQLLMMCFFIGWWKFERLVEKEKREQELEEDRMSPKVEVDIPEYVSACLAPPAPPFTPEKLPGSATSPGTTPTTSPRTRSLSPAAHLSFGSSSAPPPPPRLRPHSPHSPHSCILAHAEVQTREDPKPEMLNAETTTDVDTAEAAVLADVDRVDSTAQTSEGAHMVDAATEMQMPQTFEAAISATVVATTEDAAAQTTLGQEALLPLDVSFAMIHAVVDAEAQTSFQDELSLPPVSDEIGDASAPSEVENTALAREHSCSASGAIEDALAPSEAEKRAFAPEHHCSVSDVIEDPLAQSEAESRASEPEYACSVSDAIHDDSVYSEEGDKASGHPATVEASLSPDHALSPVSTRVGQGHFRTIWTVGVDAEEIHRRAEKVDEIFERGRLRFQSADSVHAAQVTLTPHGFEALSMEGRVFSQLYEQRQLPDARFNHPASASEVLADLAELAASCEASLRIHSQQTYRRMDGCEDAQQSWLHDLTTNRMALVEGHLKAAAAQGTVREGSSELVPGETNLVEWHFKVEGTFGRQVLVAWEQKFGEKRFPAAVSKQRAEKHNAASPYDVAPYAIPDGDRRARVGDHDRSSRAASASSRRRPELQYHVWSSGENTVTQTWSMSPTREVSFAPEVSLDWQSEASFEPGESFEFRC